MIKKFINKILGNTPVKTKEQTFYDVPIVRLKQDDIVPFKAGFDLTGLPVVTLYQGEQKLNFLLDTGSTDCIIDSNIIANIDYKLTNKANNLMGMEGNNRLVQICEITLYFNNKGYTYEYQINDMKQCFDAIKAESGVTLHGIIGSKFFNKFKYVLDFDELIAYSKK